jgi:hypothetical protein
MARGNKKSEGRAARSERPGYGEDALRDARAMGYPSIQAMYDDMEEIGEQTPEQRQAEKVVYEKQMSEYQDNVKVVREKMDKEYPEQTKKQYESLSGSDKSISDSLLGLMKATRPVDEHNDRIGDDKEFAKLAFFSRGPERATSENFSDQIGNYIASLPGAERERIYKYMAENKSLPPSITSALDRYVDEVRATYNKNFQGEYNGENQFNYRIEVPIKLPPEAQKGGSGTPSSIPGFSVTRMKKKEGKESLKISSPIEEKRENYDFYTVVPYERFKGIKEPRRP